MDDEERILNCQWEIFRLRGIVRYLEADTQRYGQKLMEKMETFSGPSLFLSKRRNTGIALADVQKHQTRNVYSALVFNNRFKNI